MNLVPGVIGLMAAGITAGLVAQGEIAGPSAAAAAWLAGYSLLFAAVELWA
jgi:hypothetical protein